MGECETEYSVTVDGVVVKKTRSDEAILEKLKSLYDEECGKTKRDVISLNTFLEKGTTLLIIQGTTS